MGSEAAGMTVGTFDSREPYLCEPSVVLRSRLGIGEFAILDAAEYTVTGVRALEIRRGRVEIPQTCDAEHLRAPFFTA